MKNILIVGDSFAADWTVKYKDHYLGWPNLLSANFNVTNLAQAGCGEYKIWLQLTSIDIKDYDFIIVSHTSPSRIYVKNHPIHNTDILHKNSDLIYNDIVDHSKKHKELKVIVKFFEEYFDLHQAEFVHKLIQQQIIDYIKEKTDATIIELSHMKGNIVPNTRNTIQAQFLYHETQAGLINHYSSDANKKVFNILKSIINDPLLRDISVFETSFLKSKFCATDNKEDKAYPYPISYEYNSRGFRDIEWPTSIRELKKCVWCFGDSQTLGVGDAYENTWPKILEKKINKRCINVSAVGVSNDWIFSRVKKVINVIKPKLIVIQWSFLHRYEENNEQKHFNPNDIYKSGQLLVDKFKHQYEIINQMAKKNNIKIIHSSVLNDILNSVLTFDNTWNKFADPSWAVPQNTNEFDQLEESIINEIKNKHKCYDFIYNILRWKEYNYHYIFEDNNWVGINPYDFGRDNSHFGSITANIYVDDVIKKIREHEQKNI